MRSRHRLLAVSPIVLVLALAACGQDAAPKAPAGAPPAAARVSPPFLWVVDGPPRVYLFGTIHLPDPRVLELAPAVRAAHAAADVVWGELSLEELSSPKAALGMMLPDGKTLADVVPKATMDRLTAYLKSRDAPVGVLERMKPLWAATFLPVLDALPMLASHVPMDRQLLTEAAAAKKETGGLETVAEQMAVFEAASDEVQARMLDEALAEAEKARDAGTKLMDVLVDAYAKGDLATIHAELAKMEQSEDPDVRALGKRVLADRNAVMVDRLVDRAKRAPEKTYFVLIGAGHLPGPQGVLALLEKKGWNARRLDFDAKVEKPAPRTAEPAGVK